MKPARSAWCLGLALGLVLSVYPASPSGCCGNCDERVCVRLDAADQVSQLVEMSSFLFYGRVIAANELECCESIADVSFRILASWKGSGSKVVVVRTGENCGHAYPFAIGTSYLLSATGRGTSEDPARLNLCEFPPLDGVAAAARMVILNEWQKSADDEFAFPTLKSQPATIHHVTRSAEHYVLTVFNRSSKTIRGIDIALAGTRCTRPYKPGWPHESRENMNITPGAYAEVNVSRRVLDGVAAGSLASCGRSIPTEIAVTYVRFKDGANWDLGTRVQSGERLEGD